MNTKMINVDMFKEEVNGFDMIDEVMFCSNDYINVNEFINYIKHEDKYNNEIKELIDGYIRYYKKYDEDVIEKKAKEINSEVIDFMTDIVDYSSVESC